MWWISRSVPPERFTAKDWLAANSSDLKWIVIVTIGFLIAVLITSHPL
jgi:hypothetical protein